MQVLLPLVDPVWLLVQPHHLVHRHLRRPDAVLDRKHRILGDLDELPEEGEVGTRGVEDGRAVGMRARKELGGDVGEHGGDAGRVGGEGEGEVEVSEKLGHDLLS